MFLGYAAARKLDTAGWRLDEGIVRQGAVDVAVISSPELSRLSALNAACQGNLEKCLHFEEDSLQKWAGGSHRVFLEVFQGQGFLSAAVSAEGVPVAPGIDAKRPTYGQHWDLTDASARARFCWLICEVLMPLGVHFALPCDPWCALGKHAPDEKAWELAKLSIDALKHQEQRGLLGSFEGPLVHALLKTDMWTRAFGSIEAPCEPWQYATSMGACSTSFRRTPRTTACP